MEKLRTQKKLPSLADLRAQIARDILAAQLRF
jgi:FAD synthase